MEVAKHDDNFDKLFEEVFEKQTRGCTTAEDYSTKEMNRLREENKSMGDSLRRLRQMRTSLEKDKNIAESEIITLRAENRAMSLRIRELEETILNDRLKKLKGGSVGKTQQIIRAESSSNLTDLSVSDSGSVTMGNSTVTNDSSVIVGSKKRRAYGSDPFGSEVGKSITTNKRPSLSTNALNTSKSREFVVNAAAHTRNVETMLGSDLVTAMSTEDSFPEKTKTTISKQKPATEHLKDSDEEAEFDEGGAARDSGVKKKRQPAVRPAAAVPAARSSAQLSFNSSTWSLNDHCNAVVTSNDPKIRLSSLKFLLKRFETGFPSLSGMLDNRLHEVLGEIIAARRNDEMVQIALMVLNNLIVRCKKAAQFQKVAAVGFVPSLVAVVVQSRNQDLHEHSLWVLDNLVKETALHRTQALDEGILPAVLNILIRPGANPNKAVTEMTANLLCALAEGVELQRSERIEVVHQLIQALALLLNSKYNKGDVTASVINALAHVLNSAGSESNNEEGEVDEQKQLHHLAIIKEVLSDEVIPHRMITLFANSRVDDATCLAALDIVSTLAADCTEQQLSTLLSLGVVEKLGQLLMDSKRDESVCANACECLSNVCKTGGVPAIQAVIDADLVTVLLELTTRDASESDDETAVYATYCVLFAVQGADLSQTQHLVDLGCLPVVCSVLEVGGARGGNKHLVVEAIRTIGILLRKFRYLSDFDHVASIVQSAGGWESVTRLRLNKDLAIRQLAIELDLETMRASYPVSGPISK